MSPTSISCPPRPHQSSARTTDGTTTVRSPAICPEIKTGRVFDGNALTGPPNPANGECCGPHNNPAGWEYSADRYGRPGWRTVHCNRCGRFVGYQPPESRSKKKPITASDQTQPDGANQSTMNQIRITWAAELEVPPKVIGESTTRLEPCRTHPDSL